MKLLEPISLLENYEIQIFLMIPFINTTGQLSENLSESKLKKFTVFFLGVRPFKEFDIKDVGN